MADTPKSSNETRAQHSFFVTTSWTAVVQAVRSDSPGAKDALTQLCRTYWRPLFAYLRRLGKTESDARDLTQEFFYVLLSKNYLNAADRRKGKFRSFLLTAFKRFLCNEQDRATAAKRGGGQIILSLDQPVTEGGPMLDPASDVSPAMLYDRQWAADLFHQAEIRLRDDYTAHGKAVLYERLAGFLEGESAWGNYAGVARELEMSSAAVAMAVHRLRQRFADVLREEVARTLVNPTRAEIESELRQLVAIYEE